MKSVWPAVVLTVIALVLGILGVVRWYGIYADVDATIDRAQLMSTPKVMADELDVVIRRMESYGMTSGHAALIFRNPLNDMALEYTTLKNVRDNARQIQNEPVTSVTFQTGMKNMRDNLTALHVLEYYWFMIRDPLFWALVTFGILAVILWVWYFLENPY